MYDEEKEPKKFVIHAEMHIHGQRVMLSDWSGNKNLSVDSALQMVVIYNEIVSKVILDNYEICKCLII